MPQYEYDPSFFNEARGTLQDAAREAMPSTVMRDTAASRIRARLSGAQQGQEMQLKNQFAGRGLSTSGMFNAPTGALNQSRSNYMGTLGSALADNEMNFEKSRQEGAKILTSIGEGQAALGLGMNRAGNDYANTGIASARQAADAAFQTGSLANDSRRQAADAAFQTGSLANDADRQAADAAFQTGTLNENTASRQAETLLDSLKTFGQYGNVSGQHQFKAFADAIQALFRQQGMEVGDFGEYAPPPGSTGGSGGPSGRPSGDSNLPAAETATGLDSNGKPYTPPPRAPGYTGGKPGGTGPGGIGTGGSNRRSSRYGR